MTLDEGDNDAVVLWSHVIEALGRVCPGSPQRRCRRSPRRRPLLEVVLPRLVNELAEQGEARARPRRLPPALERLGARERRVVRRPPAVVGPARALDPHRPGAAARRAARARPAARAARRRAALHRAEAAEFLNGRLGLELADATSSCSSRAPRAGRPASTSRRCRSRARRTSTRSSRRSTARARTSSTSSPSEVLAAYEPELQTFMLRTSVLERLCAPLCDAVLGQPASAGALDSLARSNLFLIPLDDQPPVVPLPPPVRADPARRARAARARARAASCTGARTSGTARPARPTRRSTTRSRRTRSARPGELIAETWVHYANAGRTTSVLDWLARVPRGGRSTPTARLLLVKAWVARAARPRGRHARRGRAGARARRARRRARCRTASPRSSRACRC